MRLCKYLRRSWKLMGHLWSRGNCINCGSGTWTCKRVAFFCWCSRLLAALLGRKGPYCRLLRKSCILFFHVSGCSTTFCLNQTKNTFVRFLVVPDFPVLVNGGLGPEVSCCDNVSGLRVDLTLFAAEEKLEMGFAGASDELREFSGRESEGAWFSSIDVDVFGLSKKKVTAGEPDTLVSLNSKVIIYWFE